MVIIFASLPNFGLGLSTLIDRRVSFGQAGGAEITKKQFARMADCLLRRRGNVRFDKYDRLMHRRRNEVERLFRRLKGCRRIFSRFDKLDVMFTAFIHVALIFDALRLC